MACMVGSGVWQSLMMNQRDVVEVVALVAEEFASFFAMCICV